MPAPAELGHLAGLDPVRVVQSLARPRPRRSDPMRGAAIIRSCAALKDSTGTPAELIASCTR